MNSREFCRCNRLVAQGLADSAGRVPKLALANRFSGDLEAVDHHPASAAVRRDASGMPSGPSPGLPVIFWLRFSISLYEKGVVGYGATATADSRELIRFGGEFVFDPVLRRLTRDGRRVRLERIPADVLCLLLRRPGELVTRAELVESVWGAEVYLDADNCLNGAIRKIRRALGESADEVRFIQTINGSGYLFIASIDSRPAPPPPAAPAPPPYPTAHLSNALRQRLRVWCPRTGARRRRIAGS